MSNNNIDFINFSNSQKSVNDILLAISKKIDFFKDLIQKTILFIQKNKNLEIISISEATQCIEKLGELIIKLDEIDTSNKTEEVINNLQLINNELSGLFKNYGTENLEDLLLICFGSANKLANSPVEYEKFELLKKYFHPISYKVINKKDKENINDLNENKSLLVNEERNNNFNCHYVSNIYKQFYLKVYGLKIYINSNILKKNLIIFGYCDPVIIDFFKNKYITNKIKLLNDNLISSNEYTIETFELFVKSLTLNDFLINDNICDIYKKFNGILTHNQLLKQKQISTLIKEFNNDDLFNKRSTLIDLLIKSVNYDNLYLAYLLYDLLSNDNNGKIDSTEQTLLYDSFPWIIKEKFKYAMKKTIQYTNELSNFDINKIPLEQQICLLKTNDSVKEKAMMKLKEVKAKSEDSGTKARQYLDGLLKIPFGVYKKEPIFSLMNSIKLNFKNLINNYNLPSIYSSIIAKDNYTNLEILYYLDLLKDNNKLSNINKLELLKNYLVNGVKNQLLTNLKILINICNNYSLDYSKYTNLSKEQLKNYILNLFDKLVQTKNEDLLNNLINEFSLININNSNILNNNDKFNKSLQVIDDQFKSIKNYMNDVRKTLDKAIHGHSKAKNQIENIIGQWINGQQQGYCFGFEGPPGLGKTTLAKKGLSNCLKDEDGISRPFAMIQMGGETNGSTLHGHNYTYVGSTWGSIVQILIDKKCMNPIIYIDEVDKISKTEHGKEIIGILTHLLDPAQNDCFQDKYFNGIDIDLSKALFILSYNDRDAIDKILLDRVHIIKFDNLSLEDKLIIAKEHILPDIYKKMGLQSMINIDDNVIKFLIDEYTLESGVRKLKELLFEIIGELNLEFLKNNNFINDFAIPINLTIDLIKNKYLKDKHEIKIKKIHAYPTIGIINGLWANSLGKGGIIPIQTSWRPSTSFLSLNLTGMQGDVMKESMNVALTLAWDLTPSQQKILICSNANLVSQNNQNNQIYQNNQNNQIYQNSQNNENTQTNQTNQQLNNYGIHIHCPENSVPKDGPSAGSAITIALYSLFNSLKIRNDVAITGEICLNGNVSEIGGLELKLLGGLKAGIKEFIFPNDNKKDYLTFKEKYKNIYNLEQIKFYSVENIQQIIEILFI